jgi:hypothetical protein
LTENFNSGTIKRAVFRFPFSSASCKSSFLAFSNLTRKHLTKAQREEKNFTTELHGGRDEILFLHNSVYSVVILPLHLLLHLLLCVLCASA